MDKPPEPIADRPHGDDGHTHRGASHHWSLATKLMAGGFVTIVAPVLVAFIVKVLDPPAPPTPAPAASAAGDPKSASADSDAATIKAASVDPTPDEGTPSVRKKPAPAAYSSIFNGTDLTGWVVTKDSRWSV